MKLVDDTPMRAAWMPWCFAPGDWRLVVVVKATLELPREGRAHLAQEQDFVTGDLFWDDDPERCVRYDGDLALTKPHGELWLTGTLRTAEAVRELSCAASVGELQTRFSVLGDRWWRLDGGQTEPRPFTEMPLSWERSFGGPGYAANPVGLGVAPDADDPEGRVRLPNIEQADRLIRAPSDHPEPAGAWPVPRGWLERTSLMGVDYGDAYFRERWPYFAADFRWTYFQGARAGQRLAGFWRGDELVELRNLHPDYPHLRCRLPGLKPRVFLHERGQKHGPLREVGVVLDTVAVDAGLGRAFLVWRGTTPCQGEALEEFEHLFVTQEPLGQARAPAEYVAAFIATLRRQWEEDHALEAVESRSAADVPPEAGSDPGVSEEVEPPTVVTPQELLAQHRQAALEQGLAPEMVERLFPAEASFAPDPEAQRQQVRASIAVTERLGMSELATELKRVEAGLEPGPRAPSVSAREPEPVPPPGLWTSQELREQVQARMQSGEPLSGLMLTEADLSLLDLSGQDLSRSIMVRVDLSQSNLDGAKLDEAILDEAKLEGTSFRSASLRGSSFVLASADGADFTRASLEGAMGSRAMLVGAVFRQAQAAGLELEECLATGADFEQAQLEEAELGGSDFDETSFRGARLTDARLAGASLRRACLDHVDATQLRASDGADFSEATVRWAKLASASFARSICIGTKFAESDLTRAVFSEARLEGAELLAVRARGAVFDGANMAAASLHGADLLGARFEGASLALADLRLANAYEAEFWKADVERARFDGANLKGTKLE